jgi:MoaA/NifB/PqqE/SkfB family radical SAM enzyme
LNESTESAQTNGSFSLFPELDMRDLENLRRDSLKLIWLLQNKVNFLEEDCLLTTNTQKLQFTCDLCKKLLEEIPVSTSY